MKAIWMQLPAMVLGGGMVFAVPPVPEVGGEDYRALVEVIKPAGKELKWLEIGWGTDLWAAREKAAAEGKPIFLWEMDGHPLACT